MKRLAFAAAAACVFGAAPAAAQAIIHLCSTPCYFYTDIGYTFDGTIPDDGQSYLIKAHITAGVGFDIGPINQINTLDLVRDGSGGFLQNYVSRPDTYLWTRTENLAESDATWDVIDFRFTPLSHPYNDCATPGPVGSKCGEYTDWWWNGAAVSFTTPGNIPQEIRYYVTISPVPEPATWALSIAGVAVLGGTLRRRKISYSMSRPA